MSDTSAPASVESARGHSNFWSWFRAHPVPLTGIGLLAIIVASTWVNLWWVGHYRRGLPFDIDESGYILRALEDAAALTYHGVWGFLVHLHSSDPQAPLLPAAAGVFRNLTGVGPIGLIAFQQFFFVILLLSTYWISRRVGGRFQALAATAVVAAVPGVFDSSRAFDFGLVAAAMLTLAIGTQLWAARFDRWVPAVAWGVAVGLATLSRTMVLGLLPGLYIALAMRMWASGLTWRRMSRIGTGVAISFVVAWSWYSASWRNVLHYLSSYGYGSQAAGYGTSNSVLSTTWWTTRPIRIVRADLLGPTTALLLICLLVSTLTMIVAFTRRRNQGHQALATHFDENPSASESPGGAPPGSGADEKGRRLRVVKSVVARDEFALAVFLVYNYFALSSTVNQGLYFELPIISPLVILLVAGASRTKWSSRIVAALCLVVAATVFVVDSGPWVRGKPVTWGIGSFAVVAFDAHGTLLTYIGLPVSQYSPTKQSDYLKASAHANRQLSAMLIRISREHGRSPVLLLATQDLMTNTNSLSLDLYELLGYQPPVGIVESPGHGVSSFFDQLTLPQYGEPNLVIVGPNSNLASASVFDLLAHPLRLTPVLRRAGFSIKGRVTLADGRVLQIWWKDVGPVISTTKHAG